MKYVALIVVCFMTACYKVDLHTIEALTPPTTTATATIAEPSEPPVAIKNLSLKEEACEQLKQTYGESQAHWISPVQTVAIERHYQRVIRKTCDGTLISDKVETVKSPRENVTLKIPIQTDFRSVFVFNRTTCDHKLTSMPKGESLVDSIVTGWMFNVVGDGKKKITLKGDVANALLTFELAPGMNSIFVDFYLDCAPQNISSNVNVVEGQANCDVSKKFLRALYPVQMNYSEKTLPDTKLATQGEKGQACHQSDNGS